MKEAEEEKYKLGPGSHSSFISNALLTNLTTDHSFLRSNPLDIHSSSSFNLSTDKSLSHLQTNFLNAVKPDPISGLNSVQLNQLYTNYGNLFNNQAKSANGSNQL